MATTEHTINDALAEFLRQTRAAWRPDSQVSSENTGRIRGSASRPDIIVSETHAAPVVVETEVLPAVTVEAEARSRLGQKLSSNGRTILASVAVRMPLELRKKQSTALATAISDCSDFEFCMFTGESPTDCQRWPTTGWLRGGAADISLVVQGAGVPPAVIDVAADTLVAGVSEAAGLLAEIAQTHPAATAKIGEALHQEDGEQTRRMACAILANAFVFHENLEGGPGDLGPVRSLEGLRGIGQLTKAGLLGEWRRILKVNYWAIFDIARRIMEIIPASHTKLLIDILSETADRLLENRLMRA